jgi:hypothetical protein
MCRTKKYIRAKNSRKDLDISLMLDSKSTVRQVHLDRGKQEISRIEKDVAQR